MSADAARTPASPSPGAHLPLVSVVVPAYNHGDYVREAIESLLAQEYPRLEVVVIDDGSTDDTVEILRGYGDRILWETQPNSGQSAALNRGWHISGGEVVSYLSADDQLRPGAVRRAVDALRARPDAVFVYGDFDVIDSESRVFRTVRAPECDAADMIAQFITLAGPGGFFRRAALDRAGGWDARFRQNPDVDFLFRLALTGAFVRVPHVMAAFRMHGGSQTYQPPGIARAEEPIAIVEQFFARRDLPESIRRRHPAARASAHALAGRHHLRASRWRAFLRHALMALRIHPRTVASLRTVRLWAGALRR